MDSLPPDAVGHLLAFVLCLPALVVLAPVYLLVFVLRRRAARGLAAHGMTSDFGLLLRLVAEPRSGAHRPRNPADPADAAVRFDAFTRFVVLFVGVSSLTVLGPMALAAFRFLRAVLRASGTP